MKSLVVSSEYVQWAIHGSADSPDGLCPQHLSDMVASPVEGSAGIVLESLTSFINFVLAGIAPSSVRPVFFGASLVSIAKKSGGVHPIAVGCTLRCLAK